MHIVPAVLCHRGLKDIDGRYAVILCVKIAEAFDQHLAPHILLFLNIVEPLGQIESAFIVFVKLDNLPFQLFRILVEFELRLIEQVAEQGNWELRFVRGAVNPSFKYVGVHLFLANGQGLGRIGRRRHAFRRTLVRQLH